LVQQIYEIFLLGGKFNYTLLLNFHRAEGGDSWPAFTVTVDKGDTHKDGYEGMKAFIDIQGNKDFEKMLVFSSTRAGEVMVKLSFCFYFIIQTQ